MKNFIKRYVKYSFLFMIPILIIMLFLKDRITLITGLLYGNIIRLLTFYISYIDLKKSLNTDPRRAKKLGVANYLKRYLIYGLTMAIAIESPKLNIWGTFIGLILLSITIHILNIYDIRVSRKNLIDKKKNS